MPTILASAIIDKVEIVLQDTANVHWSSAELLGWLNDAQRELVILKPDACVVTKSVLLAEGTKQNLGSGSTADAIMLLKVTRNMGEDGTEAGTAIRVVPGDVLDAHRPGWHSDTATATAKNVVYDPRSPKQFYVYPPSDGTGYVEVMYSAVPTAIAAVGNVISVDDVWANSLADYVLYRAYSKPYVGDPARAVAHYQAFAQTLGVNTQQVAANNPNLAQTAFNPAVPGAAQ